VEALENLKENAIKEIESSQKATDVKTLKGGVASIRDTDVIRLYVGELEIAAFAMKVNPAAGCGCGCGCGGGGGGGG